MNTNRQGGHMRGILRLLYKATVPVLTLIKLIKDIASKGGG